MRVLLTGASSFTGCRFASELAAAGHEVTVTMRSSGYGGVRGERVDLVGAACERVEGVAFGDDTFVELVRSRDWDLLCLHGAHVDGYRSPDFDVGAALAANTHRAGEVVPHVPRLLLTCGPRPEEALCDGPQALLLPELAHFLADAAVVRKCYLERVSTRRREDAKAG